MAFNQSSIEQLASWCRDSLELAPARRDARAQFFGDDDPRPVEYVPGAGEPDARERRFLGFFLFDFVLPSGVRPVEFAVRRLYEGRALDEALAALKGTRFVFAAVKSVVGRSVFLELEDEQFEVRSPAWVAVLAPRTAVAAHLVPVRHGYWLLGPGWVSLPFQLGPGIRSHLKKMQQDQVGLERMLQSRASSPDREETLPPPEDDSLEAAVGRMTNWAVEHGHPGLVLPVERWSALVVQHLNTPDTMAFYREVMALAGSISSQEEAQDVAGLATNIWNNTPQPDRGGMTANQMAPRTPRR